jgi:predicted O-methyltransferase YrrM
MDRLEENRIVSSGRWCALAASLILLVTCVVAERPPDNSATAPRKIAIRNATKAPVDYRVKPSDRSDEVEKVLQAGSIDRYPTEVSLDITFESGGKQLLYQLDPSVNYAFRYDLQGNLNLYVGSHTREDIPDLAPYVPTPNMVVEKMLQIAEVEKGDVIIDLGCGDGRIVITAAKEYGARGIGVDIDPQLIEESNRLAKKAGVDHLVDFRVQDATKTELSSATVVSLYLTPDANELLRPRLEKQLKPGSRVITHDYPIRGWKSLREETMRDDGGRKHSLYLYVIEKDLI